MKIGGKDIAVGLWYLGLRRSDDGSTWSLAFIDPAKARKSRLDAYAMDTVPVEFSVPMVKEQAAQPAEKLTVTLTAQKDNMKNLTLRITWGRLQLMVPIAATVDY